ncbi:diadenylate cyclase CdaA [Candidatus Margulisiibacteriota bacterium]
MKISIAELLPLLKYFLIFLDVVIVFFIVYRLLTWITNTHAENLMKGLFWVFLVYITSHYLGLTTLNWLLGKFATVLVILLIIIFQPELRRFLERIGSSGNLFTPLLEETRKTFLIKQILRAVEVLSQQRIGALIVIEISTNLQEYIDSGVYLSGQISSDLLVNLFWPKSPIHDGAVIIRENKIEAAGCLLPLSDSPLRDRRLGTRHRAAIGLSECSDALIIIVSEESGIISIAEQGNLTRYLTKEALETRLFNLYQEDSLQKRHGLKNFIKFLVTKRYN